MLNYEIFYIKIDILPLSHCIPNAIRKSRNLKIISRNAENLQATKSACPKVF